MKIVVEEHPDTLQWWWSVQLANGTHFVKSCRAYGSKRLASDSARRMNSLFQFPLEIEFKELAETQRAQVRRQRLAGAMH